jgi:adenine-specific DNA glycosylase
MAFGMDEPTLDGNLRRVYARPFDEPACGLSAGEKLLWALAAKHLARTGGDYSQALMDLGANACRLR